MTNQYVNELSEVETKINDVFFVLIDEISRVVIIDFLNNLMIFNLMNFLIKIVVIRIVIVIFI